MNEAEAIVRALAAQEPRGPFERRCQFCTASGGYIVVHKSTCTWERARAWVEANP